MDLAQWAIKWRIHPQAIKDWTDNLGLLDTIMSPRNSFSETVVQAQTRLDYSQRGAVLWRNNVGAAYTQDGKFFRYGLANDSKAVNEKIKSSDLVGIQPVVIRPNMIGRTVGQFVARECKKAGWKYRATAREQAQLAFINLVLSLGGDAAFTRGEQNDK